MELQIITQMIFLSDWFSLYKQVFCPQVWSAGKMARCTDRLLVSIYLLFKTKLCCSLTDFSICGEFECTFLFHLFALPFTINKLMYKNCLNNGSQCCVTAFKFRMLKIEQNRSQFSYYVCFCFVISAKFGLEKKSSLFTRSAMMPKMFSMASLGRTVALF